MVCGVLKIYWSTNKDQKIPAQVMFGVPAKKIKKAVTRNMIKRRIREAYRKNKQPLFEKLANKQNKLSFLIIYINKTPVSYNQIEQSIKKGIEKLIERC